MHRIEARSVGRTHPVSVGAPAVDARGDHSKNIFASLKVRRHLAGLVQLQGQVVVRFAHTTCPLRWHSATKTRTTEPITGALPLAGRIRSVAPRQTRHATPYWGRGGAG